MISAFKLTTHHQGSNDFFIQIHVLSNKAATFTNEKEKETVLRIVHGHSHDSEQVKSLHRFFHIFTSTIDIAVGIKMTISCIILITKFLDCLMLWRGVRPF